MTSRFTAPVAALVAALVAAPLAALVPAATLAQGFPSKSVRIVVPFAPGGVADIVARTVAPKLSEGLGQPVLIENRPGAGGILAAEAVARAEPDGHTLLLVNNGTAVSAALFKALPYDAVNDFAMVSSISHFGLVIVTDPASPAKTVQDLIAAAKASPGAMNLGTIGIGSTQNLAAELFRSTAGINLQIIPYKATPEVFAALKNRDAHAAFEFLAPVLGQIRAGSLRALAVTSAKRSSVLPDVPTAIESGLAGFDVSSWNGLAVPAKTPRAAIARLHQETVKAVAAPEVQKRLLDLGVEGRSSTPEELREFFLSESRRWARVVEAAKIEKR